jgi:hypothetical protein
VPAVFWPQKLLAGKTTGLEAVEACEIPIFRNQGRHSGFSADGNNLRIEDKIADCVCLANGFFEESDVARSGQEDLKTWRFQNAIHSIAGFVGGVRRIKQLRVGYDTYEFSDAERGNSPRCVAFSQRDHSRSGVPVVGQLFPMGIDEDVRVDCDQPRPSIFS